MTTYRNVAVLGAGTMGHALALVHALGGCEVRLQDLTGEALDKARALIGGALETLQAAGGCTATEAETAQARITCTTSIAEAVQDADLVVEAVVENAGVKREVFAAVDAAAPDHAIIASNTSYLDIFPLVPERRAAHTMIVHWYTPPYIIDLVDVVGSEKTERAHLEQMRDFLAGLGKKPILLERFIEGFIANRLQSAMSLEVYKLLDEGYASPEAIDHSIKYGLAARMALMGHFGKADFTGLDMVRRAMANGTYKPPVPRGQSPALEALIAQGRGGVMDGAGFYDYGGRSPVELMAERDRKLLALKDAIETIEEGKGEDNAS
ncbi:3-hydroxyacyl-CoA dehydrogenase family protein (plasmid) [Geminicoccaceae bacterium 1502E]|nr:3-hydroxyacyl-CoA dehydrogenase family protein [Geminicoccaceae bacterium 1502E]